MNSTFQKLNYKLLNRRTDKNTCQNTKIAEMIGTKHTKERKDDPNKIKRSKRDGAQKDRLQKGKFMKKNVFNSYKKVTEVARLNFSRKLFHSLGAIWGQMHISYSLEPKKGNF